MYHRCYFGDKLSMDVMLLNLEFLQVEIEEVKAKCKEVEIKVRATTALEDFDSSQDCMEKIYCKYKYFPSDCQPY